MSWEQFKRDLKPYQVILFHRGVFCSEGYFGLEAGTRPVCMMRAESFQAQKLSQLKPIPSCLLAECPNWLPYLPGTLDAFLENEKP